MTGKSRNSEQVNVVVRCRPMTQSEKARTKKVVTCNSKSKELSVTTGNTSSGLGQIHQVKTYNFDKVFGEKSTQMDIYDAVVSAQLDDVLSGYNCTVLAYGQTGTGKTYTMEGEQSEGCNFKWDEDPKSGIIPRALSHLFDRLNQMDCEYGVRISLLEIYNEEIYDLLSASSDLPKLRIFDDSSRKGSVVVSGLTEVHIRDKAQVYEILQQGSQKRRTAATNMNEFSSRSHSVFSVTVHTKDTTQNNMESEELVKIGKLNLVDLAGSENIGRSGAVDKRAREAGNINTSLLTLGRCITALVDKAPHIPYRESKLTRLLQDSLGGATKTSIIATISPGQNNIEETLSTLDYAFRSKSIHNRPKINQKLTKKALIQEYDREINRLRREVEAAREKNGVYLPHAQYQEMLQNLEANEAILRNRFEELESYKELFQLKESELDMTKAELTATFGELQLNKEKLDEVSMEKRKLARYGNELYGQATQLNDTVTVVKTDITKVHAKVDRVQQVNEENIKQFHDVLADVKEEVEELQAESVSSVGQIGGDLAIIINKHELLNDLNEQGRAEVQQLLGRLNEIYHDVGKNKKLSICLNEKREKNSANISNEIQEMKRSVGGLNIGDVIKQSVGKLVTSCDDVMTASRESLQSSHKMVTSLGDDCMEYHRGVVAHMGNNRMCYEQITNHNQKHREADDKLKEVTERDDASMFSAMRRDWEEGRRRMEEMLTEQEEGMRRQHEEMMAKMVRTRQLVIQQLAGQQQQLDQMEVTSRRSIVTRHQVVSEEREKIYGECDVTIAELMTSCARLEDDSEMECGNVEKFVAGHQQLIESEQGKIDKGMEDVQTSSHKLRLEVEESEEKTRNELVCHLHQLQQDCADYDVYVTKDEATIVQRHQELEDKLSTECVERVETINGMNEELARGMKKEADELRKVEEKTGMFKMKIEEKFDEIETNLQIHRRKLVRPIPTGETPARNATYRSVAVIGKLPQFALEDLDETCELPTSDIQQESMEVADSDDDDDENDVIDGQLDESVTIPDRGGIPFFKTKGGRKQTKMQREKGLTPLRTLQSNNISFDV